MSTSNNKWPTPTTSRSTAREEEEMPSLINSDSSRGALEDSSEHSCSSGYSDHTNNNNNSSNNEQQPDNGERILQATSADSFADGHPSSPTIDRCHRSATTRSISSSPPRQRPRSRARGSTTINNNRRAHCPSRSRSRPRQSIQHQRPRSRSRPRAGRSISRSRAATRQQHQQQQHQPANTNTRAKSPARSTSQARLRSRPNPRFSYSRRASLNGTTIYRTPAMATLDTHLRNTSGLRLQTDGTCNFLFENQRFVLESNEEDAGDYLFYASFGSLKELQQTFTMNGAPSNSKSSDGNKSRNLLRMLATWNEELKQRSAANGNDTEGQQHQHESTGLLRIDSSKSEGPHVAFIYYGHMEDITNSAHFQETLDDFVDDALDFKEKLQHGCNNNNKEEEYEVAIAQAVKDADSILGTMDNMGQDGISTSIGNNKPMQPPPLRQQAGNREALNNNASLHQTSSSDNTITGRTSGAGEQPAKSPSDAHESKESVATLATTTASTTTPITSTTIPSSSSLSSSSKPNPEAAAITSTDIYNAHNKKSVFTKMIQSLRSKTTNSNSSTTNSNGVGAYIDPNNPSCAFVVDKNDASPRINLSRGGGGGTVSKRGSLLENESEQRTKSSRGSMVDESTTTGEPQPQPPRSPHRRGSTMTSSSRARTPVRGRSFHVGEERFDHHNHRAPQKGRSFHVASDGISPTQSNNARPARKSTSFATTDEYYGAPPVATTTRSMQRKSKSFATDDYYHRNHNGEQPSSRGRRQSASLPFDENGRSQTRGRSTKRTGSKSFHTSDEINSSSYHSTTNKGKSKSFHHTDAHSSSRAPNNTMPKRSSTESSSDYEHSNQSIDIYDQNANVVAAARAGLHQSEPMVSQRYPIMEQPPLPPPPPGRPSSSRRHHSSRRNSADIPSGLRSSSSSSSRHHHNSRRHSTEVGGNKGSSGSSNRHPNAHHHRPSRSSAAGNASRMNQSEPILSAQRKNSPTPFVYKA